MSTVISPELVLVDPQLRRSLIAEYCAGASQSLLAHDWTATFENGERSVFHASSDVKSDQLRPPLVIAAVIRAAALFAEIFVFAAIVVASLTTVITALTWIP